MRSGYYLASAALAPREPKLAPLLQFLVRRRAARRYLRTFLVPTSSTRPHSAARSPEGASVALHAAGVDGIAAQWWQAAAPWMASLLTGHRACGIL
jgi:hypothetical protein